MMIIALFIACLVGGASAGCYNDWRSCRSACGAYGAYGAYSWGACSGGVQLRPAYGVCGGATPCGAPCGARAVVETRSCGVTTVVETRTIVVVPSRWTAFSAFGACSVKCGAGVQTRTRACILGTHGLACVGAASESRACGTPIINSKWTGFSAFSACSVKCGAGTQTRRRACIAGNACGAGCVGPASETRACGTPIIHSRLTAFSAFSACSVKCGAGTQTRTRACIAGNECGNPCVGALSETRACGTPIINSKWTAFSAFGACSVKCGAGTQTRTRACIAGNECGAGCVGAASETRACGTPIINSRWSAFSAFSAFSACAVTGACGTGVQTRTRTRSCIPGNSCGAGCVGAASETETRACQVVCQQVVTVRHHVVAAPAVVGGCAGDLVGSCGAWGAAGFCGSYPGYMASNCCNSCAGYISSYIKEKPDQQKWTDEMFVQKMNEELKKKKKK